MSRRTGKRQAYNRSGRRSYYVQNVGLERAQQHIREAAELSRELGGMDKDVKDYFFNLPAAELSKVLDEYRERHGQKAYDYALETIPKWRSGKTQMAGQTASRLFRLLPPRMPLERKFKLTEGLWAHVGPSSHNALQVGSAATTDEVVAAVRMHIEQVVAAYRIPEDMERRFEWLSAGDVGTKQALLNHLRRAEREVVVGAAQKQLPMLLAHIRSESGSLTTNIVQSFKVGKHKLDLVYVHEATGVTVIEPRASTAAYRRPASQDDNWTWVWWLLGAAVFWLVFIRK